MIRDVLRFTGSLNAVNAPRLWDDQIASKATTHWAFPTRNWFNDHRTRTGTLRTPCLCSIGPIGSFCRLRPDVRCTRPIVSPCALNHQPICRISLKIRIFRTNQSSLGFAESSMTPRLSIKQSASPLERIALIGFTVAFLPKGTADRSLRARNIPGLRFRSAGAPSIVPLSSIPQTRRAVFSPALPKRNDTTSRKGV